MFVFKFASSKSEPLCYRSINTHWQKLFNTQRCDASWVSRRLCAAIWRKLFYVEFVPPLLVCWVCSRCTSMLSLFTLYQYVEFVPPVPVCWVCSSCSSMLSLFPVFQYIGFVPRVPVCWAPLAYTYHRCKPTRTSAGCSASLRRSRRERCLYSNQRCSFFGSSCMPAEKQN